MSVKSSAAYQAHLTSYAQGIGMEAIDPIAELFAPTVQVSAAQGFYKQFSDKNAFQVLDTARAIGGPATRLEFAATDPTFNCLPQALEIGIDDHEREAAGSDPWALEQAKIKTLVQSARRSHAVKVYDALAAAVSGTGKNWNSLANPIEDIDAEIVSIATTIGEMPNTIIFGLNAWATFRKHAKVLERFPGADIVGVNTMQAAQLLINPSIRIVVSTLVKDTAKRGVAKSNAQVVGASAWIFHSSPAPSLYDPSFAKTFRTNSSGVDAVYRYRDDKSRSDIYAVDWSEDIKVTSSVSASRLTITSTEPDPAPAP